jgi:ABC-type cobalamin/Fe3+-siderophores transport system ATPase subunit
LQEYALILHLIAQTTLLSLLRGKAFFAHTSGEIRVNGKITPSLIPFAERMAFVPQDDIMYDELTVSDNLKYAALLFNKRGYTKGKEVIPMVHHAMELLGLSHVKHSIVGKLHSALPILIIASLMMMKIRFGLCPQDLRRKRASVAGRRSASRSGWS